MPRAFITGITGQDGQHLAEFLHGKGYEVFGMVKGQNNPQAEHDRATSSRTSSWCPATSPTCRRWSRRSSTTQPDEVYNLGAISFVALSASTRPS